MATAFHRRLQHGFLQKRRFFDEQCAPLFRSLHPHTVEWMLTPRLSPLVKNSDGVLFSSMREALETHGQKYASTQKMRMALGTGDFSASALSQATSSTIFVPLQTKQSKASKKKKSGKKDTSNLVYTNPLIIPTQQQLQLLKEPVVGDDTQVVMEGLKWLDNAQRRLENSRFGTFLHKNYEFEIGDVVYQKQLGQVGVVADRLPVCFENDEWVEEQLESSQEVRLKHPWYLILVASHRDLPVDMTRYGSALSHTRSTTKMSIGFHSLLPVYFEGYDAKRGVYIPRKDKTVFAQRQLSHLAKSQQISISSIMSTQYSKRVEEES
eukprot:GILI01007307.1.p1 GENE.GILI01007307.1~~GILI01007307.1.p1  ORF type:complete len:323 (-),score=31.81 GILI01007307.1:269-1237(-)